MARKGKGRIKKPQVNKTNKQILNDNETRFTANINGKTVVRIFKESNIRRGVDGKFIDKPGQGEAPKFKQLDSIRKKFKIGKKKVQETPPETIKAETVLSNLNTLKSPQNKIFRNLASLNRDNNSKFTPKDGSDLEAKQYISQFTKKYELTESDQEFIKSTNVDPELVKFAKTIGLNLESLPTGALGDAIGMFRSQRNTIELVQGLSPEKVNETMQHEIIHALQKSTGIHREKGLLRPLGLDLNQQDPREAAWVINSYRYRQPEDFLIEMEAFHGSLNYSRFAQSVSNFIENKPSIPQAKWINEVSDVLRNSAQVQNAEEAIDQFHTQLVKAYGKKTLEGVKTNINLAETDNKAVFNKLTPEELKKIGENLKPNSTSISTINKVSPLRLRTLILDSEVKDALNFNQEEAISSVQSLTDLNSAIHDKSGIVALTKHISTIKKQLAETDSKIQRESLETLLNNATGKLALIWKSLGTDDRAKFLGKLNANVDKLAILTNDAIIPNQPKQYADSDYISNHQKTKNRLLGVDL